MRNKRKHEMTMSEISKRFGLKWLGYLRLKERDKYRKTPIVSDKVVYVCSNEDTGQLLKVGQTTNWKGRFVLYRYKDRSINVRIDMFEAKDFNHQDEGEERARIFLDSRGHALPWDNTNCRLTKPDWVCNRKVKR